MSLNRRDIAKNISVKAQIPFSQSQTLLEKFFNILIKNSNNKTIKISKFGTFYSHTSPARVGRNPKTKEEFKITEREKIIFRSSNKIRNILN